MDCLRNTIARCGGFSVISEEDLESLPPDLVGKNFSDFFPHSVYNFGRVIIEVRSL